MQRFPTPFTRRLIGLILAVILAGAASTPAFSQTDPAAETLATLQAIRLPPRDRVRLARELLGVESLPPPIPAASAPAYQAGDVKTFHVVNVDNEQRRELKARLAYVSERVYMWFEEGFTPDIARVRRSAEAFDTRIYPAIHGAFGTEANPGIDGDPRLHILHARSLGQGVAAYFDAESEFPRLIAPDSNEHQMFMVNLDTMAQAIGTPGYEGVLAHEFQHMVHANMDANEAGWLDEGLAELAADIAGYREDISGFARAFTRRPGTQLNTWSSTGGNAAHYGASYLFSLYFRQRFGAEALEALVANPADGFSGIEASLEAEGITDPATGAPITAEALFADWVVTLLANDSRLGDGRFSYSDPSFRLPELRIDAIRPDRRGTLDLTQFGTTYLSIDRPGEYELEFTGAETIPVLPMERSGAFWWSNRGDASATSLTRAFDLRNVQRATLSFALWYAIEEAWDYAYLQVSTDGGRRWQSLPATGTRPAGGHNNPYGPAFTGSSGWRTVRADLSAYAGQEILIRFLSLSDEAVNLPGMAIDDMALPEIGYQADFETDDGGWQADGFARIQNMLPARYSVQAVEYDADGTPLRLTRLIGPESAATGGTFPIRVGGETARVVLAISGLTQYTTERSPVAYTLRRVQ